MNETVHSPEDGKGSLLHGRRPSLGVACVTSAVSVTSIVRAKVPVVVAYRAHLRESKTVRKDQQQAGRLQRRAANWRIKHEEVASLTGVVVYGC